MQLIQLVACAAVAAAKLSAEQIADITIDILESLIEKGLPHDKATVSKLTQDAVEVLDSLLDAALEKEEDVIEALEEGQSPADILAAQSSGGQSSKPSAAQIEAEVKAALASVGITDVEVVRGITLGVLDVLDVIAADLVPASGIAILLVDFPVQEVILLISQAASQQKTDPVKTTTNGSSSEKVTVQTSSDTTAAEVAKEVQEHLAGQGLTTEQITAITEKVNVILQVAPETAVPVGAVVENLTSDSLEDVLVNVLAVGDGNANLKSVAERVKAQLTVGGKEVSEEVVKQAVDVTIRILATVDQILTVEGVASVAGANSLEKAVEYVSALGKATVASQTAAVKKVLEDVGVTELSTVKQITSDALELGKKVKTSLQPSVLALLLINNTAEKVVDLLSL